MPASGGFQPGRSAPSGSRRTIRPSPLTRHSVDGAGKSASPSRPNPGPRKRTAPMAAPTAPPAAAAAAPKVLPLRTSAATRPSSTPAFRSIAVRSAPVTVCGPGRTEVPCARGPNGRASRKNSVSSGSMRSSKDPPDPIAAGPALPIASPGDERRPLTESREPRERFAVGDFPWFQLLAAVRPPRFDPLAGILPPVRVLDPVAEPPDLGAHRRGRQGCSTTPWQGDAIGGAG